MHIHILHEHNENFKKSLQTSPYHDRICVFGEGSEKPKFMMIGEAPGAEEELSGRPFVGKAGKNLSEFLERLHTTREEIYITNVVKIRPRKESEKTGKFVNRPPNQEELDCFVPFLLEEIERIAPPLIVTLGNISLQSVMQDKKARIGDYHGAMQELQNGQKLFPLYHPAAIIYNQKLKETYENDLLVLQSYL